MRRALSDHTGQWWLPRSLESQMLDLYLSPNNHSVFQQDEGYQYPNQREKGQNNEGIV